MYCQCHCTHSPSQALWSFESRTSMTGIGRSRPPDLPSLPEAPSRGCRMLRRGRMVGDRAPLRRRNLYTLEGGVHRYLAQEGGSAWDGSLFVFDDRLAVPAGGSGAPPPPSATLPGSHPAFAVPQVCIHACPCTRCSAIPSARIHTGVGTRSTPLLFTCMLSSSGHGGVPSAFCPSEASCSAKKALAVQWRRPRPCFIRYALVSTARSVLGV